MPLYITSISYTLFVNIAVELKCSTSLYGTMKCKFNSFHSINVSTFSIDFVLSKNRKKSEQLLKKPSGNYTKSVSNTWKCGFFGYGYSWCEWEHLQNGKKIHMKWISIKMACISTRRIYYSCSKLISSRWRTYNEILWCHRNQHEQ